MMTNRHSLWCGLAVASLASVVALARGPLAGPLERLRQLAPTDAGILERDAADQRDARAAVRLLRLGQPESVWPLLQERSDNTRRSYLIEFLGPLGADAATLIERLRSEPDVSARRALILSLGGFGPAQLTSAVRDRLIPQLLEWYRLDVDPGSHSAIDWLLRYGRRGELPRRLDWQQAGALARIDREFAGSRPRKSGWSVLTDGETTMVNIEGPVAFEMGAPLDEPGRIPGPDSPDEPRRHVRIPRSFAIASKEVTVGQFRRFLDANPEVKRGFAYPGNQDRMASVLLTFSPDDRGPQIAVTWYEAAMYCNWLSRQEGIPESEWVYPPAFADIKSGMVLPRDYLHRSGFRLPTEAEWEYAARAGSTTSRFFGRSDDLLSEYAWYARHPPREKNDPVDPADPQHVWPVGQLKPNDFGLFDVYGNVWEWTLDRMQEMFAASADDVEDTDLVIADRAARSRRGGGFPYGAAWQRSADRDTKNASPEVRRDNVGFRVARTIR